MTDLIINFSDPKQKQFLWDILKGLTGEQVIKIKKRSKGRSLKENKYYWGVVLDYIANFTGHSPIYLHEHYKWKFIPLVKFSDDYKLTSSDMSHDEIWSYINAIREEARDVLKLAIPDPDGVIL